MELLHQLESFGFLGFFFAYLLFTLKPKIPYRRETIHKQRAAGLDNSTEHYPAQEGNGSVPRTALTNPPSQHSLLHCPRFMEGIDNLEGFKRLTGKEQ